MENQLVQWIQKIKEVEDPLKDNLLYSNNDNTIVTLITDLYNMFKKMPQLKSFLTMIGNKSFVDFLNSKENSFLDIENLVAVLQSFKDIPYINSIPVIDWNLYLGSWEQVFAGSFSLLTIEQAGIQNNAFYRLLNKNTISIYNTQKTITGKFKDAKGVGIIKAPGQLSVKFDENQVPAPYWIVAIGPVVDNQYQWSVVSDPFRINLFILARNRIVFKEEYQEEVLTIVKELGFSYAWNTPIPTV